MKHPLSGARVKIGPKTAMTAVFVILAASAVFAKAPKQQGVEYTLKVQKNYLCQTARILDPVAGTPTDIGTLREGSQKVRMPETKAPFWRVEQENGAAALQEIHAVRTPLVFADNMAKARLVSVTYVIEIDGDPALNLPSCR